jgi:glycosyltransferase involved in cell wall biosynthesis
MLTGCGMNTSGPSLATLFPRATRRPAETDLPLTVLLSVHNAGQYLRDAVQSILNQTFTDFEFLIINDGSTDNSLEVLNEFAQRDPRIRIVSRANRGLTRTLNEGINLARGEFLARMDGDDIALPDRLQKQVQYLQSNPECELVGCRVLSVDPQGFPIREICQEQTHDEIDSALMNRGWPLVHPAVTMRTATLRDMHGYREKYRTNQDHDLFLRLAERGKLANLPDLLLHYRQHFKSISMGNVKAKVDPLGPIVHEAYHRRGILPPDKAATGPRQATSDWDQHQQWGWTALANGYLATARRHACATVAKRPLALESWRMMYCALRGR